MKKYTRPVLEMEPDMAEGVYLASGDTVKPDGEKKHCRFGRTEANPGSDTCQTCSVTGGATDTTPEGQESYRRDDFKGCPDNMPIKE